MNNLFQYIKQFNKNNAQTYGELLENNVDPTSQLSQNEKEMYNELKARDINRFKINENKNLVDTTQVRKANVSVGGIGNVTQVC